MLRFDDGTEVRQAILAQVGHAEGAVLEILRVPVDSRPRSVKTSIETSTISGTMQVIAAALTKKSLIDSLKPPFSSCFLI